MITPYQRPPGVVSPGSREFLKCLIYGAAGSGKTTFLGTANQDERTFPILVLDYEGGTSSLKGVEPEVDIFPIRSWEDYNEAYHLLSSGNHPYRSVALDSISESHIFALMNLLDSQASRRKIPDLLEQGDYGIALVQMRRLLRAFRDLPLHIFATALDRADIDPREGTVRKPALAGALSDEVLGIFDVVGFLGITAIPEGDTTVTHRVLVLQNYPKIRSKVRAPFGKEIPDEILDPTVSTLLDILV